MMKCRYIVSLTIFSLLFFLSGCEEKDSGPAATSAESSGVETSLENVEKAEGVVYQDEIYANWPYN